jgi:transcriptional regulator with XRE-family HTH domain
VVAHIHDATEELPPYLTRRLGDVVRAWQDSRQLTATELAHAADLPKQLISEILRNKTRETSRGNLAHIAAALGISPLVLVVRALPTEAEAWFPQLIGEDRNDSPAALGAAVFGSPISLQIGGDDGELTPFGKEVAEIVALSDLPRHERRLAEDLIKGAARVICQGLKDDLDRQRLDLQRGE